LDLKSKLTRWDGGNPIEGPGETIFIVDDDPRVLRGLARLLRCHGLQVRTFTSAKLFLEEHDPFVPGCLILDVAMPDLTGLELQDALEKCTQRRMIIFLSGHGDIPVATRAMRAGAVHFLTKPVNDKALLSAVHEALERDRMARIASAANITSQKRLATLTPREREVMERVVDGRLNKEIASELGTVEKTVKVHRGRVMSKMGARSLAELVRIALRLGIGGNP